MLNDSIVMVGRNLTTIKRVPTLLATATLQPLMFVFLFAYVFGATFGGGAYREYLMAGIFTQTVAFNAAFTTVGLASDLQEGIVDRLRSLPMSRMAVILGRTASDLVLSVISVFVMSICGLIVGWRIRGSFLDALLAYAIILLFGFAMSWTGAWVGLLSKNVEVAQSFGFAWLFPVTFLSSAFVSAQSLPGPLKPIAEWNPVTAVATSCRELFGNKAPALFPTPTGWVAEHATLYSIVSSLVILAIFVPLATLQYRKVASR
ncbi:ABC transporter permease [Williamsia sp. CHRR-6]|uniref:ABC transporter permease n=1 Tax=Williamsia sp. CHRR-6 TaxID=2835871 RepID=UPI001BDA1E44|nr:ABC transporter permease [Williamsia sp. CHRR-6]MBT0566565.1 ABC transporter permease [Williamsia sp. CHRR-6]